MNAPDQQQWIEIRNEIGQLYYFNKIVIQPLHSRIQFASLAKLIYHIILDGHNSSRQAACTEIGRR